MLLTSSARGRVLAGLLAAGTAVPVLAGLPSAAAAHSARPAHTTAAPVAVAGTACPDVPSPSFCVYSWTSGTGRFTASGFADRSGHLVMTGTFTGTTSSRGQEIAVTAAAAEVPVGSVSVTRRAVIVHPATVQLGPYVPGGAPVTTTSVTLSNTTYPAPGAVYATVGAVTVTPARADGAQVKRDWRRAGSSPRAQAAALTALLAG